MLTLRMRKIVDLVSNAKVAADVGCDHGYVAKALIEEGRASKVIACDISEASLEKAKRLACVSRIEKCMETRQGNGLAVLGLEEADVVVIAGMGGMLICQMLFDEMKKAILVDRFVLSPNKNEAELRRFLFDNGFEIEEEELVFENEHFYQIMCAKHTGCVKKVDDFYCHVGKKLIEKREVNLKLFLKKRIEELENILKYAANGKNTADYSNKLNKRLCKMREVQRDVERG